MLLIFKNLLNVDVYFGNYEQEIFTWFMELLELSKEKE